MKQEYIKGGWVKVLSNYGEAKVGDILQISSLPDQTLVNVKKDGHLVGSGLWTEHSGWDPQCEWYGMEAPTEKKEPVREQWQPKVGEYAVMTSAGGWSYDPRNNGCIGLIEKVGTRENDGEMVPTIYGKLINPITECYGGKFENIPTFGNGRLVCRKALSHEIPQQKTETMETYKPQIGDWCYIINAGSSNLSIGKVYKCNDIIGDRQFHFDIDGMDKKNNSCWMLPNNLRKALPEEIPHTERARVAPVGEMVEEAKRRFPIGCDYICKHSGRQFTIKNHDFTTKEDHIIGWGDEGYVLFSRRWAEKIEEKKEDPIAEAKRRFPMGTKFIPFDMGGKEYTVNGNNYYDADKGQSILVSTEQGNNQYLRYMGKWSTKVEEKTEDLLSKARRLYPIGTQYRGVRGGDVQKAIQEPEQGATGSIWVGYDYVYMDGKWAEIVSSYEQEERSYERELGTKIVKTMSTGVEKMPSEIIVKRKKKLEKGDNCAKFVG